MTRKIAICIILLVTVILSRRNLQLDGACNWGEVNNQECVATLNLMLQRQNGGSFSNKLIEVIIFWWPARILVLWGFFLSAVVVPRLVRYRAITSGKVALLLWLLLSGALFLAFLDGFDGRCFVLGNVNSQEPFDHSRLVDCGILKYFLSSGALYQTIVTGVLATIGYLGSLAFRSRS